MPAPMNDVRIYKIACPNCATVNVHRGHGSGIPATHACDNCGKKVYLTRAGDGTIVGTLVPPTNPI
jgi:uncharacterized protein (DUF983 family)